MRLYNAPNHPPVPALVYPPVVPGLATSSHDHPLLRLLVYLLLSTAIGAGVEGLMELGGGHRVHARGLAAGGLIGICICIFCYALAHFTDRWLTAARPALRRLTFAALMVSGTVLGWSLAVLLSPYLLNVRLVSGTSGHLVPVGIAGAVTLVVGSAIYTYEILTERIREQVAELKEKEFADKELQLAGVLQRRLLPPTRIEGDEWLVCARHLPARHLAGDFYDVFPAGDQIALIAADVSGKGLGASLIMALVKGMVPHVAPRQAVADVLILLNRRLAQELGPREFVALAHARYDPSSGRLRLANAGLPHALIRRADGRVEELVVPEPRLPLGLRPDAHYSEVADCLQPGDRLILLSDGMPEAMTRSGQPLGYGALNELVAADGADPERWLDDLIESVARRTRPDRDDDWTVLVLERPAD